MLLTVSVLVYGSKRVVFVRLCTGVAWEDPGDGLAFLAIAIGSLMSRRHLTWWWALPTTKSKTGDILLSNYLTKIRAT